MSTPVSTDFSVFAGEVVVRSARAATDRPPARNNRPQRTNGHRWKDHRPRRQVRVPGPCTKASPPTDGARAVGRRPGGDRDTRSPHRLRWYGNRVRPVDRSVPADRFSKGRGAGIGWQPGVYTGGLFAHMGAGIGCLTPQKSDRHRLGGVRPSRPAGPSCHVPCRPPTLPGAGRTPAGPVPGRSSPGRLTARPGELSASVPEVGQPGARRHRGKRSAERTSPATNGSRVRQSAAHRPLDKPTPQPARAPARPRCAPGRPFSPSPGLPGTAEQGREPGAAPDGHRPEVSPVRCRSS